MQTSKQALPCLVVLLAGLPGVGKTTLARVLAPRIGADILSRDDMRDAIFPERHLDFSAAQNEVATRTLLDVLEYVLRHSPPTAIVVDGKPFSQRREIEAVAARVAACGADMAIIHCIAPAEEITRRLENGLKNPRNVKAERNPEKAERIRREFEPINRPHLELDTSRAFGDVVAAAIQYLNVCREPVEKYTA